MSQIDTDFYVGYESVAAPSVRRVIRNATLGLGCVSIFSALILIAAQGPFADSRFEYGQFRDYTGELVEWPYPVLITPKERYLLVGAGKFGVADLVRGHDGERTSLRGALISRGPDQMLEVDPGSLRFFRGGAFTSRNRVDLGEVVLTGEIVDTKCHLGVMNPGEGKVHRDCAVRCISGGAPPGFLVRDASGETRLLLLVGGDGRALGTEVLDYVAEPIRIGGRLVKLGASLILRAEPRDFQRE